MTISLWLMILQPSFAQEIKPLTAAASEPQTDTAVEDITNRSSWMDDLFSQGSPFHFGLTAGETFDDNIFISPRKESDFITDVAPSVDFEKGNQYSPYMNYLNLYLATTFFMYARHEDEDRENYNLDGYYQHQWSRLTLGVEERYQHLTNTNIDIGNFAVSNINSTTFFGNYTYNDNLSLYGSASQVMTSYPERTSVDTNEWVLDGYTLYQLAPKLQLGAGPRIRFTDIIGQPNESDQALLAHLKYGAGEKLTISLTSGVEYLQYQGNSPSHVFPIFDLTAAYAPQDGTYLSLSASRQDVRSFDIVGESILNTSLQASFRQRFLQDFYFNLSAGYTKADYEFGSERVSLPQRDDDYYFAGASVEWEPKTWLRISAGYRYSQDQSTYERNTFNDNQIDIQSLVFF